MTRAEAGAAGRRGAVALGAVALGAFALGSFLAGSAAGALVFVLGLAVFLAPGLALSWRGFARFESPLVGAAVGYLLSSLIAAGLYRWGLLGTLSTAGACVLGGLGLRLGFRRHGRARPSGDGEDDKVWLAAAMGVALVLVAVPFLRVGASTPEGVAYRAYFSADLMTHLSVVAEIQKESFPPENPFYSGERLGYYWLFFVFPALMGRWIGNQEALLLTYVAGGLLFSGLAYSAARRLTSPRHAFVAVLAGVLASGYEGLATLARSAWVGEPLGRFTDLNVDAFSRWVFELTSLDGLHRSLLYTPQHLFSYSLLLVLILLVLRDDLRGPASSLFAGLVLGGMAGASIVTAMLAGPWAVLVRLLRSGSWGSRVQDAALMGLAAFLCLGFYLHLGFFGEAGTALTLRRPSVLEIPTLLALDCGALILVAAPALRDPRTRPIGGLAAIAFLAVLGLDIQGYQGVWMAWRAGSVFLVCLVLIASRGIEMWPRPALAAVLLPASVSVLLDVYNAQDISNRRMSAGDFRWTTVVSHAEMDALFWVRSHTASRAVVQYDARAREPGEWALIPALGQRRMAVGFPIFLLEPEKYAVRERRHVRPVFTSGDPVEAHRRARRAGIHYLFIGRCEIEVRGESLRGLWESPDLFRLAYSNQEVTIFEVLP